jgi:hypothetical protein
MSCVAYFGVGGMVCVFVLYLGDMGGFFYLFVSVEMVSTVLDYSE